MQDTVPYLANKYNIEIPHRALTEDEIFEMNYIALYREVAMWISKQEPTEMVQKEIERRQWSSSHLSSMMAGSCPDYHALRAHLKALGFTGEFLDETDIAPNIFSPNNLILSICDAYGRPVGFTARNLRYDGVVDHATGRLPMGPKYIATNCKGMRVNVFNKAERLYNLHVAKQNHPPLYIFEGHPDVITANLHGIKNAVGIGAPHVHINAVTMDTKGYSKTVLNNGAVIDNNTESKPETKSDTKPESKTDRDSKKKPPKPSPTSGG